MRRASSLALPMLINSCEVLCFCIIPFFPQYMVCKNLELIVVGIWSRSIFWWFKLWMDLDLHLSG